MTFAEKVTRAWLAYESRKDCVLGNNIYSIHQAPTFTPLRIADEDLWSWNNKYSVSRGSFGPFPAEGKRTSMAGNEAGEAGGVR